MKDLISRLQRLEAGRPASSRLQEAAGPSKDAISSFKRELDRAKKSMEAFERDHLALVKKVEKAFEDGDEEIRKMVKSRGDEWGETDEGQEMISNVYLWSALDSALGGSEVRAFFRNIKKVYTAAYDLDDNVRWG